MAQQVSSQQSSPTDQEDEILYRQLRLRFFWISMTISILWILAVVITGVVAFCVTLNPLYLPIFTAVAPAILWMRWAASYVIPTIPMDEKTFELEKIRIQGKAQRRDRHMKSP